MHFHHRFQLSKFLTALEAPPTFTLLQIEDPTEANDRIIVTFALNEPGTAYCRPTRSDSGETAADMHINRILTASWSSTFTEGDLDPFGSIWIDLAGFLQKSTCSLERANHCERELR